MDPRTRVLPGPVVLAGLVAIVVAIVSLMLVFRARPTPPMTMAPAVAEAPMAPAPAPAAPHEGAAPAAPPAAVPAPRVALPVAAVVPVGDAGGEDLSRPEATVATQLRLLGEGRDDAFRETFLPAVRARVTPDAIEVCRRRYVAGQTPVRPDWEMAESAVEDGHRVRRVSMFGRGLTGFHEVSGRWLADAVWCVPAGLP